MTIPKTYWDGNGKYQTEYNDVKGDIPISGPVSRCRPALEKLREASNAYYDIFNNGGRNKGSLITLIFGRNIRSLARRGEWDRVHAQVEPVMDQIILDAHAERGDPATRDDVRAETLDALAVKRAEALAALAVKYAAARAAADADYERAVREIINS